MKRSKGRGWFSTLVVAVLLFVLALFVTFNNRCTTGETFCGDDINGPTVEQTPTK